MHFQIDKYTKDVAVLTGPTTTVTGFTWRLVRADESIVCRSSTAWPSERELRSQLAKDKKSMAGCSRYKVRSPE